MKYIDADKLTKAIEDKGLNCSFALKMERLDTLALINELQQEQPVDGDDGKFVKISVRKEVAEQFQKLGDVILAGQSSFIRAMNQQEQPEVDLDKFTEKVKTFQARYKHPEIVSIKGAMAFMARMFYQYPNVARQWYEQLPKATMDDARKEE